MRLRTTMFACAGLIGPLVAQQGNLLELYSGRVNFTGRSGLPAGSDGEVCQRFPAEFFQGLGQTADPATSRP